MFYLDYWNDIPAIIQCLKIPLWKLVSTLTNHCVVYLFISFTPLLS